MSQSADANNLLGHLMLHAAAKASREDLRTLAASVTDKRTTTDITPETSTAPPADTLQTTELAEAPTVLEECGEVKTNASTSRTLALSNATATNQKFAQHATSQLMIANASRSQRFFHAKSQSLSALVSSKTSASSNPSLSATKNQSWISDAMSNPSLSATKSQSGSANQSHLKMSLISAKYVTSQMLSALASRSVSSAINPNTYANAKSFTEKLCQI
jgi:trimeric autotransporter adhesin